MSEPLTTFRGLILSFTDFLTVAIHTILYERSVYPQTSFLSARKYNCAVRQSRHPKVCEWINDAVGSVGAEMLKGAVVRVVVVIYTPSNKPVERFVFDVSSFPRISQSDVDTPLERRDAGGERVAILPTVDMEEQLRATMSRLSNCGSSLRPLPQNCSFTVAIELRTDEPNAPVSHPQAWIPAQPGQDRQGSGSSQSRVDDVQATPIRTVQAGDMIFETWVEESKDKGMSASVEEET